MDEAQSKMSRASERSLKQTACPPADRALVSQVIEDNSPAVHIQRLVGTKWTNHAHEEMRMDGLSWYRIMYVFFQGCGGP